MEKEQNKLHYCLSCIWEGIWHKLAFGINYKLDDHSLSHSCLLLNLIAQNHTNQIKDHCSQKFPPMIPHIS